MAIAPNTTFINGNTLTDTELNAFPRGVMAYTQKITSYTTLTSSLADLGVSVTFTAVANRYYKYTAYVFASDCSSASTMNLSLTDSANTLIAEGLARTQGTGAYQEVIMMKVTTETAGNVTRKLRASSSANSGTMYASAESPIFLLVEDIGPA